MLQVKNAIHLSAPVDLFVDQDKIVTMTPAGHWRPDVECEVFDAAGLRLFPAFIDAHVHLREPGQEYKEDVESGLSAAVHGGFGAVMCMANTRPVNDNVSVTSHILARARETHPFGPAVFPIAAATIGLEGKELAPLAELKAAGCIAVSNDGRPLSSSEILRRVMEYASDLGMIYIDHCEDPDLAKDWLMHEGEVSGRLGLKGQPGCGEAIQASRDIMLAEYLDVPVHIAHVSSKLTVDVIAWAKNRGVKVTAETAPHYLLLDENVVKGYNTLAKVSPPLRTAADRDALLNALRDGIIDILATDHAPHAAHEKNTTFDDAPCGITGLDTAIALTWSLTRDGRLCEMDLHKLWAENPARIFGLEYNGFAPGDAASFSLFDPDYEWVVNADNMYSKSCNTPFLNQKLKGKVMHAWLKGHKIF